MPAKREKGRLAVYANVCDSGVVATAFSSYVAEVLPLSSLFSCSGVFVTPEIFLLQIPAFALHVILHIRASFLLHIADHILSPIHVFSV